MNREFQLIHRLTKKLPLSSKKVFLGIGDDAAVLEPLSSKTLLTVDTLVEGIHFDFNFCEPEEVGRKALAVNASDLVAMGGTPTAALVSLGVSKTCSENTLERVYEGIAAYAKKHSIDVVGGNITLNPERIFISVTLLGECVKLPLTRAGARLGDVVFLSGPVGEAAAGLTLLKSEGRKTISRFPALTAHYLTPKARLDLVDVLNSDRKVSSLIDISDGLSSELWHLLEASKVGFLINEDKIPVSMELKQAAIETKQNLRDWQWSGGEDYELLGTIAASDWPSLKQKAKDRGLVLTEIGKVVSFEEGVKLQEPSGLKIEIKATGWNHLSLSERD